MSVDLDQLLVELRSADYLTCVRAVRKASKHKAVSLLPQLYARRHDSNPVLACEARNAVERYGHAAAPFLLQLLHSDRVLDRMTAIELLSNLGRPRSACNATDQLLDDRPNEPPDWGDRRDEVVRIWHAMLGDADVEVRAWAAIALDDVGDSSEPVIRAVAAGLDAPSPHVRQWSALHLGRIGAAAAMSLPTLRRNAEAPAPIEPSVSEPARAAYQAIRRITGQTD